MSFQTRKSFVRTRNTIWDILDENRETCDCPIDCQVINTVNRAGYTSFRDIGKTHFWGPLPY